jgi:hypothetical protein
MIATAGYHLASSCRPSPLLHLARPVGELHREPAPPDGGLEFIMYPPDAARLPLGIAVGEPALGVGDDRSLGVAQRGKARIAALAQAAAFLTSLFAPTSSAHWLRKPFGVLR